MMRRRYVGGGGNACSWTAFSHAYMHARVDDHYDIMCGVICDRTHVVTLGETPCKYLHVMCVCVCVWDAVEPCGVQ